MAKEVEIRIKRTPNCLHPYTATIKGYGGYGFGNTSAEARACLLRRMREDGRLRTVISLPGMPDLELR